MGKRNAMLPPLILRTTSTTLHVLCASCVFTFALSAQAASFDCGKASTKVEHVICDDAEISKLDDELAQRYKAAIQGQSKSNKLKQEQKQWIVERNACQDFWCVQLAYEERLSLLSDTSIVGSDEARRYKFRLIKGFAEPVCAAYLKRLNTTKFETPPFCDRPENDAVSGFARLTRVPLSPAEVHDLYPIISTFSDMANQKNLDWADMNLQLGIVQSGQARLSELGGLHLQKSLGSGETKIWRYDPAIDIDNDGIPDSVEIWHGGALATVNGICGREQANQYSPTGGSIMRQRQLAFVVMANGNRLDTRKTSNIFAHPSGGYRLPDGSIFSAFRPIGSTVGIFRFKDVYYFDTFFDSRSDFEDKRKNDAELFNTLGVFLHKDGKTKQVCEYQMTGNEAQ